MKMRPGRHQIGVGTTPQPLWMRVLTVFCVLLLGVASTAQVCHSHDEAETTQLRLAASSSTLSAAGPVKTDGSDPAQNSAVNCPLCVAMHSALPVAQTLTQIALLHVECTTPVMKAAPRLFLWRFEQASRPPPVPGILA